MEQRAAPVGGQPQQQPDAPRPAAPVGGQPQQQPDAAGPAAPAGEQTQADQPPSLLADAVNPRTARRGAGGRHRVRRR